MSCGNFIITIFPGPASQPSNEFPRTDLSTLSPVYKAFSLKNYFYDDGNFNAKYF